MNLDPNNAIVRLCVAGVARENEHRFDQALALYMRAWDESANDVEWCIAAHYVARHQKTAAESLRWNLEALNRANAVQDERMREFYPSLYLNVGKSYEETGDKEKSRKFYQLARGIVSELSTGPYRDLVRDGAERGLQRVSSGAL